jgi:hypothetical protein
VAGGFYKQETPTELVGALNRVLRFISNVKRLDKTETNRNNQQKRNWCKMNPMHNSPESLCIDAEKK